MLIIPKEGQKLTLFIDSKAHTVVCLENKTGMCEGCFFADNQYLFNDFCVYFACYKEENNGKKDLFFQLCETEN